MEKFNCRTGCLRDELDENMETVNDVRSELEDNFQSAEPDPLSQKRLEDFKVMIDAFKDDLDLFNKHCQKCEKKGGKLDRYNAALNRAQELWEVLAC